MFKLLPVILLACITGVSGCSTVRVSQNYGLENDFSHLKTYQWQPKNGQKEEELPEKDQLIEDQVREAVESNLDSKGFRKDNGSEPDFLIDFQYQFLQILGPGDPGTEVEIGSDEWAHGVFSGTGIGQGSDMYPWEEEVLDIYVTDPKSGYVLWRGKGTLRVAVYWKPETKIQKIDELVEKILAEFPPGYSPS